MFQVPGLAEALLAQDDGRLLAELWRLWSPGYEADDDLGHVRRTFARRGVGGAALAYYRTSFDAGHPRAAETQALLARPVAIPTLGVTGEADGCVGSEVFEAAMRATPYLAAPSVRKLANAGHFLHLEAPDATWRLIGDFLSKAG
jgi:pimeloyl-ACP methyl ester carboxylesterase